MANGKRLEGKTSIITGAASGIGRATAILFAQEGSSLVLADVNQSILEDLAKEISENGSKVEIKKTDVSDETQIKELVDFTLEKFQQVDIVCNNAGITGNMLNIELHQQKGDDWIQVYSVNVLGAVYMMKYISKHMCERKAGSIVNTSSVAGIRSGAGPDAYSASKAALINYTKTSACDLAPFNVRVNAVCPGLIRTAMTEPVFAFAKAKGKEEKLGMRCEMQRYGRPEEVASAILFLASDEASYITGQALPIDGGVTASLERAGQKF